MHYPDPLLRLIDALRQLPGVGAKSAERYAFALLEWPQEKLTETAQAIESFKKSLLFCQECGCMLDDPKCPYCQRHSSKLCIVAHCKDIFSLEHTREFSGHYHVLGALFSPIHGKAPHPDSVTRLKRRICDLNIEEVIIAIDSTFEGDATALYLKKELEPFDVAISRLAFGLPMGSSLDYIDGGTLARAFEGRRTY